MRETIETLYVKKTRRERRRERVCAVLYWVGAALLFPVLFYCSTN